MEATVAGSLDPTGSPLFSTLILQEFGLRWIHPEPLPARPLDDGTAVIFYTAAEPQRQCILALGETARAEDLLRGVRPPHLVVTDLPYGIQHHGPLVALLDEALPVWAGLLLPGGALAYAWDATRFSREEMLAVVGREGRLAALNDPPYDALAHRVDRVIRRRDVLVARRGG